MGFQLNFHTNLTSLLYAMIHGQWTTNQSTNVCCSLHLMSKHTSHINEFGSFQKGHSVKWTFSSKCFAIKYKIGRIYFASVLYRNVIKPSVFIFRFKIENRSRFVLNFNRSIESSTHKLTDIVFLISDFIRDKSLVSIIQKNEHCFCSKKLYFSIAFGLVGYSNFYFISL